MSQIGFFDVENRYASLDAKNDPLAKINALVPWETFRSRLEQVWRKPADQRKSNAGCKPWDAIVLRPSSSSGGSGCSRPSCCAPSTISPTIRSRYQMRDRLSFDKLRASSFVRFLGLTLADKVPDAKTVWLYREQPSSFDMLRRLRCRRPV